MVATDDLGRPYDSIEDSFGYEDGTDYTFNQFGEAADTFKKDYFGVENPLDVPLEQSEKEFWKVVSYLCVWLGGVEAEAFVSLDICFS